MSDNQPCITLCGVEQPKRIWLMTYPHSGEITWCEDQNPEGDDEVETVEYVRADLTRSKQTEPVGDEDCADVLDEMAKEAIISGSPFNQGVQRGLEIAAAQFRHGHIRKAIASLKGNQHVEGNTRNGN